MFFHYATCIISPICKISTFSEDLSFLNPRSHLNQNTFIKLREYFHLMKFNLILAAFGYGNPILLIFLEQITYQNTFKDILILKSVHFQNKSSKKGYSRFRRNGGSLAKIFFCNWSLQVQTTYHISLS